MNNSTSLQSLGVDTAPYQNDVMGDSGLRILFISMYCVIFLLGISGNSLVVYVVVRNHAMQTITNVFITNLAISDIMMCLLAAPFTPLSGLLESWVFGEALCRLVPMSLGISVHVSTLTSVAIAIDRYFVIVHPFKPRMKIPVCVALIISIWIVSISVSLPLAVYQEVSWLPAEEIYVCREAWPHPAARKFFTVATLILQYIVPCSLIIFCYARVSIALNRRARALVRRGMRTKTTSERHQMAIDRKRRTNRMLIAMVVIFVLCWLPLNVMLLILEYHEDLERWSYFLLTFFTAHVTAMSSTIYNPFLYAWMNENFQTEFRRVLPCLISSGRVVKRPTQTGVSISLYSVMESQVPLQRTLYTTPLQGENGNYPVPGAQAEAVSPDSDLACDDDDDKKQTRDELELPVETMNGNSVR